MKKNILTQAMLLALASTAVSVSASDITVYGVVNTGMSYTHTDRSTDKASNEFVMDAGNYLGNRFGLKGEEQISESLRAGFVLENGFSSDTGSLSDGGRLFGREASLYLNGDFGTVRFGRLTVMTGSTGTSGLMGGKFSATSTGWASGGHNAVFAGKFGRYDNMVMYSTPKFAGLQLHAQYSSGTDMTSESTGIENKSSVTRYMGLGAQYFNGPLSIIGVVDSHNYAKNASIARDDDSLTANLSVAWDFETVKLFVASQYFHEMRNLGKAAVNDSVAAANLFGNNVAKDGYALHVGFTAPVSVGKLYAGIGYMDAESSADSTKSMKRLTASVGYDYALSKRTVVYAGAGYMLDKYDDMGVASLSNEDAEKFGVTVGLSHRF